MIEGLRSLDGPASVVVYSDSTYVIDPINKRWLARWQARGWRTKARTPVANQDLWLELIHELARHRRVIFKWVRGHTGHPLNEAADLMAVEASHGHASW